MTVLMVAMAKKVLPVLPETKGPKVLLVLQVLTERLVLMGLLVLRV